MTKNTPAVESQSPAPEQLVGESVLSLSSNDGGQHLSVVCARAEAPVMLRELVAAVPTLAGASRTEHEEPTPLAAAGLGGVAAMRRACADLAWSRGEALIGVDSRASFELRELSRHIGALPVQPGMDFTLTVSRPAPESSPTEAAQPPANADAAPHRKVGDAHIDLTLDASDVTGKLDLLDERLSKTLALADRVAGIVTLGDLAAAISAASSVLGVLTGPDSWADTATRQRATEATLSLVARAEQLARGA